MTSVGLEYELNEDGVSYSVTGIGTCTDTELVIPEEYEGRPVTTIKGSAFSSCERLVSVTIPDSVTSIGTGAFASCSGLISITVGVGVININTHAFLACASLVSVAFGEDSKLTSIGSGAFSDCTSLENFTIPDSVTSIGSSAFYMCQSLTSITIPDGVTSINMNTFYGCSNLTSIIMGNGITSIELQAFYSCGKLTSITIPSSVISIGKSAFLRCSTLTEIIVLAETPPTLGTAAFKDTSSNLVIKVSQQSYEAYKTAEGWSDYADKLERPQYKLVNITQLEKDLTALANAIRTKAEISGELAFPNGMVQAIGSISGGSSKLPQIIDRTVTEITAEDLAGITEIGESAFRDCANLVRVDLPASVVTIGNYSFADSGIESIDLTNVKTIKPRAFYYARNLASVILGEGLKRIESNTFQGTALTNITIPSTVTSIASYCFTSCENLVSVTIKAVSPPKITAYVFHDIPNDCVLYVPSQSVEAYKSATNWSAYADRIFAIEE